MIEHRIPRRMTVNFLIVVLVMALPIAATANTALIPVNAPRVNTFEITDGDTSLTFPIQVSGADTLQVELIVPVDNATFTLLDPEGTVVVAPTAVGLSFLDGSLLTPPLPGGVFRTAVLSNPADGSWTVKASFPPAVEPTVAMLTVLSSGPIEVGLAIPGYEFVVGTATPIGVLVLNERAPVIGLSPTLTVTEPDGTETTLELKDDGNLPVSFDALAQDGLYNAPFSFDQTGRHSVAGVVVVSDGATTVSRRVQGFINVVEPSIDVQSVAGNIITGPAGCVAALVAAGSLQVTAPLLNVAITADLESATDANTLIRTGSVKPAMPNTQTPFEVSFGAAAIRETLQGSGPYSIPLVVFESLSETGARIEAVEADVAYFGDVLAEDLCQEPIVVDSQLAFNLNLAGGFIDSIDFTFPVTVQNAGSYTISFKVTGAGGQDIQQFALSRFLSAGENEITFSVTAARFQAVDGPYRVESVLALGQGASAQKSVVGSTAALSRFQFTPVTPGDLDGDADLDRADITIMLRARNSSALNPGDRRDLTGDGVIDIRDARALILMR